MKGLGTLRRALKRLLKSPATQPVILMYHQVAERRLDPWGLCVTPAHFAEHLQVLRESAHVISLDELLRARRSGQIPQRTVAITFDDGYAGNLYHAKPLLERYEMPATIFVTTGTLGSGREFWWDELERLLLQPGRLPGELCLKIGDRQHWWKVTGVEYTPDDYRRDFQIKPWQAEPGSRLAFYHLIWKHFRPLPVGEIARLLDEIVAWAGADRIARPDYCPLTAEELGVLADNGTVTIGAHSVTHPVLPSLPRDVQRQEIGQSKAKLESLLGRTITSFAYPFGQYAPDTLSLIREAEFACACSTAHKPVGRNTDPFELPRFGVLDCNGERFGSYLSDCFRA